MLVYEISAALQCEEIVRVTVCLFLIRLGPIITAGQEYAIYHGGVTIVVF